MPLIIVSFCELYLFMGFFDLEWYFVFSCLSKLCLFSANLVGRLTKLGFLKLVFSEVVVKFKFEEYQIEFSFEHVYSYQFPAGNWFIFFL